MDFAIPFILLAMLIFALGLLKAGLWIRRSQAEAKEEGREHE